MTLKSSPARWFVEPMPEWPKRSVPGGCDLPYAISSFTFDAGVLGCTTIIVEPKPISDTGANALSGSNGGLFLKFGLIVITGWPM